MKLDKMDSHLYLRYFLNLASIGNKAIDRIIAKIKGSTSAELIYSNHPEEMMMNSR